LIVTDKSYKRLTRSELTAIKVPIPGDIRSELWLGVNFGYLANALVGRMKFHGYAVLAEEWYTSLDKTDMLGVITAYPNLERGVPFPGLHYQLVIRNSSDGKYAIRFRVGAKVLVCDNGLYIGDCATLKKHTTYIKLNETIDKALGEFELLYRKIPNFIYKLQNIKLTHEQAGTIMLEAHRYKAIPFCYIRDVYEEWTQPRYAEFYEPNAWSLYNAFTHGFKQMSVLQQYEYYPRLKALFDEMIRRNGCLPLIRLLPQYLSAQSGTQ
jgi:hypothetical protein